MNQELFNYVFKQAEEAVEKLLGIVDPTTAEAFFLNQVQVKLAMVTKRSCTHPEGCTFCPWCGFIAPDAAPAVQKALEKEPPKGANFNTLGSLNVPLEGDPGDEHQPEAPVVYEYKGGLQDDTGTKHFWEKTESSYPLTGAVDFRGQWILENGDTANITLWHFTGGKPQGFTGQLQSNKKTLWWTLDGGADDPAFNLKERIREGSSKYRA